MYVLCCRHQARASRLTRFIYTCLVLNHAASSIGLDRCHVDGECRHDVLSDGVEGQAHVSLLQDSIGMRLPGDIARLEGLRASASEGLPQDAYAEPLNDYQDLQFPQVQPMTSNLISDPRVPRANMARAMERDLESAAEDVQLAWSQLQAANAHAKLAVANAEHYYELNQELHAQRHVHVQRPRIATLQLGNVRRSFDPDEMEAGSKPVEPPCGGADQIECSTVNRIITWDYKLDGDWAYGSWGVIVLAWVLLTAIGCCVIKSMKGTCICNLLVVFLVGILMYGICHDWLSNPPNVQLPDNLQAMANSQMNSLSSSMDKLQSQAAQVADQVSQ